MNAVLACHETLLNDFLLGELSDQAEADLISHLDSCERCRTKLEETAGGEHWRTEVKSTLSPGDEIDFNQSTVLFPVRPSDDITAESAGMAEQTLAVLQSVLGPTDNPEMMGRIGSYEIVGVIGRGATGIVVKAFQPALNRFVAIKVLSPELAANAAARQRFAREGQAAAAVVNEHVVPIYSVDEYRGTPFLVMLFVSGGSLERRLRNEGTLSLEAALRISMQIATGLTAAHTQGLIHRDIKPANILLDHGVERVLITDFGLARAVDDATLTHSGFVAGTPQFMSPEQARGDLVDHRTDLFSLGAVLYTLLAGRPPFRAETAYGILRRICDEPHRPLSTIASSTPRWVTNLVDRFLEKEPDLRIRSAAEAAILLAGCLAHVQNPTACVLPREVRETHATRLVRIARRPRVRMSVLSVTLAAVFGLWASREKPLVESTAMLRQQATMLDSPVSISLVVPESTRAFLRRIPDADQIEAEISALKKAVVAYELTIEEVPVVHGDGWTSEIVETVFRLKRLEADAEKETPTVPPAAKDPMQTVERFVPLSPGTSTDSGFKPDAPDFGTPL